MAKTKVPALVLEGHGPPVDFPGIPTPRGGYVPGIPVPLDALNLTEAEAKKIAARSPLELTKVETITNAEAQALVDSGEAQVSDEAIVNKKGVKRDE